MAEEREKDINQFENEIKELKEKIAQKEKEIYDLKVKMNQTTTDIGKVVKNCELLASTKSFKILHLFYRIKNQFLKGDSTDKKSFFKWLFHRNKVYNNHFYNPLYQIIDPLKRVASNLRSSSLAINTGMAQADFDYNDSYKKYDVIVLSVINYGFRYQRPQHFASRYAKNGHRVFYVSPNYGADYSEEALAENVLEITLANEEGISAYSLHKKNHIEKAQEQLENLISQKGIRDCLIIVEYPTWVHNALLMKDKFGFPVLTDYMDDYLGFINTTEEFLKEDCIKLLENSNGVVTSSNFLYNNAVTYNENTCIIRNGTEFTHFNAAAKKTNNEKKVIGYYGAISDWFDANKIEYIAKRFSDCEIHLIGEVTYKDPSKLEHSNIKLIGEIPYKDLPGYLADFDVCLIPFDTSTDLIKATNPVKFYEYLSAGKKIVSTEIPELEPFKDKYVYMSNDDTAFGDYVEKCLNGDDTLASPEECMEFAKDNDWDHRAEQFIGFSTELYKKVSIIVLCYNQLDYTKECVDSILEYTAYPNYELIMVDNCSSDGTKEYLEELEKKYEQIKVIINTKNKGFAGGNNDGIRVATGDYICLLNNDTVVSRGWITNMLKHFSNKKVGLVGPVTNSIGNESMIEVDYTDIDDMNRFAYQYTATHMNQTYTKVDYLAMFCLMIPRSIYNEIGYLDEGYGIGMFEDDDYSMAVKRKGYELVIAEDSFVHHYGSASFKKLRDAEYSKLLHKNKVYFESKWGTSWKAPAYRPLILEPNHRVLRKGERGELSSYLLAKEDEINNFDACDKKTVEMFKDILNKANKEVVVYPPIIEWEPLQTPQQILKSLGKAGRTCLFIEPKGAWHKGIQELSENVWSIPEDVFFMHIEDNPVILFITWMGSDVYRNRLKNAVVWYHILDDLRIFARYDQYYEKLSSEYVESSDIVSYVAHSLTKYTKKRPDAVYLPNACHAEELLESTQTFIPTDLKPILKNNKPIIGYFGWISEWMDYSTMLKVAAAKPDMNFVFIGPIQTALKDVVEGVDQLRELGNVFFLGKKDYKELPNYALSFDVAFIPFLINDMMDCVSPIKFYEYCAYGLPTISSYMPEMEQYECEFVSCYSNMEEFIDLLERFTKKEIKDLAKKNAPSIALENTWDERVKLIENHLGQIDRQ